MENITLTKGQEEAIKVAVQRYKDNEKYTVIAGAAGSGKTTTVRYIVDALNVDMSDVVFATFTGKASLVLRNKGCHNAMTLHRLLYIPKTLSNGDVEFEERATLEYDYKIVVVDEVSMVPQKNVGAIIVPSDICYCIGRYVSVTTNFRQCNSFRASSCGAYRNYETGSR